MKIVEKIKEMFKNIKNMGKKTPKVLAAGVTLATIGLATNAGGNQDIDVDKNVKVEQENDFKNSMKVIPGNIVKVINQKTEEDRIKAIKEEVEEINDVDTVLKLLKNEFIEDYEKRTGDTSLTTKDIEIWERTQNKVYVDSDTGLIITHGDKPAVTKQKLAEHGVNYDEKENVKIYEINTKDGQVIDCAALEGETLQEVILSRDLFTNKEYLGILTTEKFQKMIPIVFEWRKFIEQGSELGITQSKKEMIKILKEYECKNADQEIANENEDGFERE